MRPPRLRHPLNRLGAASVSQALAAPASRLLLPSQVHLAASHPRRRLFRLHLRRVALVRCRSLDPDRSHFHRPSRLFLPNRVARRGQANLDHRRVALQPPVSHHLAGLALRPLARQVALRLSAHRAALQPQVQAFRRRAAPDPRPWDHLWVAHQAPAQAFHLLVGLAPPVLGNQAALHLALSFHHPARRADRLLEGHPRAVLEAFPHHKAFRVHRVRRADSSHKAALLARQPKNPGRVGPSSCWQEASWCWCW